jgi:hypothetical protein
MLYYTTKHFCKQPFFVGNLPFFSNSSRHLKRMGEFLLTCVKGYLSNITFTEIPGYEHGELVMVYPDDFYRIFTEAVS